VTHFPGHAVHPSVYYFIFFSCLRLRGGLGTRGRELKCHFFL
jgi:hypothetical protein